MSRSYWDKESFLRLSMSWFSVVRYEFCFDYKISLALRITLHSKSKLVVARNCSSGVFVVWSS